MQGFFVQNQAVQNQAHAIQAQNWATSYAVYIRNQTPGLQPVGNGGGLLVDDWSTSSSIFVHKRTAPAQDFDGSLALFANGVSETFNHIVLADSNSIVRTTFDSTGA